MKFNEVTTTITELCNDETLDFQAKTGRLQGTVGECSLHETLEHLDFVGVIPESFTHDSTEEKLYAKYCDALLARALAELGLEAQTIEERADAADVLATGEGYSLVGDAKAFRLSRTAKNQKDFKVESLNKWRKGADYSCLVGPFYQYPNTTSQIYSQAIRYNVTLLSYNHLAFMIQNKPNSSAALRDLWQVGNQIKETAKAAVYWQAVDERMLTLTARAQGDWDAAQRTALDRLPEQAQEEINFLESEKARTEKLPHEIAVRELIKALKLDGKIKAIRRTAGM